MKKISLKLLLTQSLILYAAVTTPLLGNMQNEVLDKIEEHSRVESRQIPHVIRVKMLEEMATEESEHEIELKINLKEPIAKGSINYFVVNKPIAFVDYKGSLIETEDGMLMTVKGQDAPTADQWQSKDHVYLRPNNSWFSSAYLFKATNIRTKQSVNIEIQRRPIYIPAPTIQLIDYDHGKIGLSDGTTWDVSSFDKKIINMWDPGDEVIVGVNNRWNKFLKPYILINFEVLTYARAQML